MRAIHLFLIVCSVAALAPLLGPLEMPLSAGTAFPGWPARFDSLPLRPLPLTERETTFAADFPGRTGRFTDGEREYIIRWVTHSTRSLHHAVDCFRGIGYEIRPLLTLTDDQGRVWGRFEATRAGETLRVHERIHDAEGNSWTNVSSWYWSALFGGSRGPWWAITVAHRIR